MLALKSSRCLHLFLLVVPSMAPVLLFREDCTPFEQNCDACSPGYCFMFPPRPVGGPVVDGITATPRRVDFSGAEQTDMLPGLIEC